MGYRCTMNEKPIGAGSGLLLSQALRRLAKSENNATLL